MTTHVFSFARTKALLLSGDTLTVINVVDLVTFNHIAQPYRKKKETSKSHSVACNLTGFTPVQRQVETDEMVAKVADQADLEMFNGFLSDVMFAVVKGVAEIPITVLRDTASGQSFMAALTIHLLKTDALGTFLPNKGTIVKNCDNTAPLCAWLFHFQPDSYEWIEQQEQSHLPSSSSLFIIPHSIGICAQAHSVILWFIFIF